jgi:hypothetical protein
MALLPMDSPTTGTSYHGDHAGYSSGEAQESMFDEPAAVVTEDAGYAEMDEAQEETFFEPDEVFTDEVPALVSHQAGSGQPALNPSSHPAAVTDSESPAAANATANAAPEAASLVEASETKPEPAQPASSSEPLPEPAASAPTMLTADDFAALEDRVLRAVSLVRSERQARIAAEERAASMEAQLHTLEAQSPILDRLVQEVESLRAEREQVRQRVERLLGQLDALEL